MAEEFTILISMKLKIVYFIAAMQIFFSFPVLAVNAVTGEFSKSPEEIRQIVTKTLDKLGSKYSENDDTNGFMFRLVSPFMNLYPFDLYIGSYENGSMVRIESMNNTNNALLDAITIDATGKELPYKIREKSLALTYALTLLLPAAGHLYTIADSPFEKKSAWIFSILYLAIDGVLLYTGGTSFFTHSFDPLQTGLTSTLILLGTYRAGHLLFNHMSITANNRMVQLGYTFHYN